MRKHAARSLALIAAATVLVFSAIVEAGMAVPPSFTNYAAPNGLGANAGEPSIGVNRTTGNVMYQAGLQTLRVNAFNGTGGASWTSVGSTITSTTSLDPILFLDGKTNRTFVSQLSAGCSLMALSDDDGASWVQNPVGCGVAAGADHQTVGGGPFHAGLVGPATSYPDAVYYCAQAVATAQCSVSHTGGLTFNPSVPIYNATQCGGLHGHIKVAPDGTAYVPNADCGGKQALVISKDNGTSWTVSKAPDSGTQLESDPSLATGSGGTVYFGYQGANGHAFAAVYRPLAGTWGPSVDVGAAAGLQNVQFPAAVAGDDGKAAIAFLGTTTGGDDQAASFAGVWHLYVASTYDGGTTWSLTDATPTDPVQRGCIWLGGGSNPCRNLLDFIGADIDKAGRVNVAYADGCTSTCVSGGKNTYSALATIARQEGGDPLIAP